MPDASSSAPAVRRVRAVQQTYPWAFALLYLGLLAPVAAMLPLRLQEVLQLAGFKDHSWSGLMKWVAFTPAATPLNYFCQWPFVSAGHAPLLVRAVSLLSGAFAVLVFWRIARKLRIRREALVVALFAVLPITFVLAITARPAAEGVLFSLLATWCFLQILDNPSIGRACLYAAVLTAAVYTTPFAYAPALGFLLFFFRFVARPEQRQVIWLLLAPTFVPLIAYVPFYAWTVPYSGDGWLYETDSSALTTAGQFYEAVAGLGWGTLVCVALVTAGAVVGVWIAGFRGFRARRGESLLQKNIAVFCLFGGAVSSACAAGALSLANVSGVEIETIAAAFPLLILVFAAGIEQFRFGRTKVTLLPAIAGLLIAVSVIQDVQLTKQRKCPNLQALADAVIPELTGDSCVVFVSEHLSPHLFLTFHPELRRSECLNYDHRRIVLALHPYVRSAEQEDAESFFRGLNFVEVERKRIGGGELIMLEVPQPQVDVHKTGE